MIAGPTIGRRASYVAEEFTPDEADVLRRYFTNLDQPVFALVNLPEVVKGALFARYSRTHLSLRRLFLKEFVGDLDMAGDLTLDATVGLAAGRGALRAGVLRVRRRLGRPARRRPPGLRAGVEPADQDPRVGPAHGLPRAVDPLHRLRQPASSGRYRYYRDPDVLASAARRPLRRRHGPDVRRLRRRCCPSCRTWSAEAFPQEPGDSDFVWRQAIKAKALDAVRGLLPAASLSNVGIYGTGQALRGAAAADAGPPAARGARATPT